MRGFLKVAGAFTVVITAYFGSVLLVKHLQAVNHERERSRYTARLQEVKLLMEALQDYRSAQGSYPVLPYSSMIELKELLIKAHPFLGPAIDALELEKNYDYVSDDGNGYGLLVRLDRVDNGQPVTCKIEVNATRNAGWWGYRTPKCPF